MTNCTYCGSEGLHQERVITFNRSEDQVENIVSIDQETGEVSYDEKNYKNPSPRRQGLTIIFRCEFCAGLTLMKVWQHKGETKLAFEKG